MAGFPVGTKIPVVVGGKTYETIIDERGVQRFPQVVGLCDLLGGADFGVKPERKPVSPEVAKLAETNTAVAWLIGAQPITLNEMATAFRRNEFSMRDYAEFAMHIGYSVCGWSELSFFGYEIENPLWESSLELLANSGTIQLPEEAT